MSVQSPIPTKILPFVPQLLVEKGMNKAAIIDDAYDPISEEDVDIDVTSFHQVNGDNPIFISALQELNIDRPDDDALEEDHDLRLEYLNKLWVGRDHNEDFSSLLEPLFINKMQKLADVENICSNLGNLGLQLERIGSDVSEKRELFKDGAFQFVFLDYFLGDEKNSEAIQRAKNAIKKIHEWCPDDKKPITVLMSSFDNIEEQEDEFFTDAGVMGGVCRFSAKPKLQEEPVLSLIIGALAKEFEHRHDLQFYVDTLFDAAEKAVEEFKRDIGRLKVEDYILIQNLGLEGDDHPLGDYVAWLYSSYWGHLLLRNEKLQDQQKRLDSFFATKFPVLHGQPSKMLSQIYMTALFEEREDISPHPRELQNITNFTQTSGASQVEDLFRSLTTSLYLHLGDIFTNEATQRVWMIMNAQCDLERPSKIPPDRSILLIPGDLVPLNQSVGKNDDIRTEFFRHKDQSFRIIWRSQEIVTRRFDGILQWKMDGNYVRRHQLRLPFALEVQRAYTTNLTRIGMPVPPPLSEPVKVQVLHGEDKGTPQVLVPANGGYASYVVARSRAGYVFTVEFGCVLKQAIAFLIEKYRLEEVEIAAREGAAAAQAGQKVVKKIEKLSAVLEGFDEWFLKLEPLPIAEKPHNSGKLCVAKNQSQDVYTVQPTLLINILESTARSADLEGNDR